MSQENIQEHKVEESFMEKPLRIYGVLATSRVSLNGDLYLPNELELAVKRLKGQWIPIYLEHVDVHNAVGRAKLIWNPEKLQVEFEGEIYDDEVANKIRTGIIRKVSLGANYERIDKIDSIDVVRGLKFVELSLVAVPGIPEANIEIVEKDKISSVELEGEVILKKEAIEEMKESEEKMEESAKVEEGAIPFSVHDNYRKVSDRSWDADRAEASLRKWASSDGSGDKDKIDWAKYRKGFAWYDENDPENFGSYKLPHHEVIDGDFCVVWRGVVAAMAALMGARGGVNIPDKDRKGVYNHLAKHYREFDAEPPAYEFVQYLHELSGRNVEAVNIIVEAMYPELKTEVSEDSLGKNTDKTDVQVEMNQEEKPVEKKEALVEEKKAEEKLELYVEDKQAEEKKIEEHHWRIWEAISRKTEAVTGVPTGYAVWTREIYPIPPAIPVDLTKFVEVKTLRKGESQAKFYKIAAASFSSLTAGTEPSAISQAISTVTVNVSEYGALQEITDTQLEQAEVDLVAAVEKTMQDAAWKTLNDLVIDAVDSVDVTNIVYPGTVNAEGSLTSSDTLDLATVIKAKRKILEGKVTASPGELILVISPKQYYDLLTSADLTTILTNEPAAYLRDALEMILGCRIIVTDQVNTGNGSGSPPITTYHAILFKANDAVALALQRELRIEAQRDVGKRSTKFMATIVAGAKVKLPEACCKIYTA